jgi:Bifunctional DNA primase/polymerase, N-terminal
VSVLLVLVDGRGQRGAVICLTDLRLAALSYAATGYEVLPLRGKLPHPNCPECTPRSRRYRPHAAAECPHELCHGLYAATNDPERVGRWWSRWPADGIGARVPRQLIVLDIDPRHDGDARLAELAARFERLPPTRVSYSGRGDGGRHLWFLHPGGKPTIKGLREVLGRGPEELGLDLKGHEGYVVLPPSRHPETGRPYRWAEPLLEPAPMPGWLCRLLLPPPPPPRGSVHLVDTPRLDSGPSIADAFAARVSWREILEPHGWRCLDQDGDQDGARWRHAEATHATSATIRHGLLFVYSTGTPFEVTEPGEPHGYTKFRAYAVLEHGGDLRAAAKALPGAS